MEYTGNLAIQELFETVNSAIGMTNVEDNNDDIKAFYEEHFFSESMAEDAFYYGGIDDSIDHRMVNKELLMSISGLSSAIIFGNEKVIKQKTNHLLSAALKLYNLELGASK
jgi:hypothetical protein